MTSKEYYDQIKQRFDRDILEHEMTILQDESVYRHLRFMKSGTTIQYFNLTTFPNHLCISGDMGTFVFSRVEDMFRFFRNDRGAINPSYWGEKLQSISTNGGYEKFNVDDFKENIKERFDQYRESLEDEDLAGKIWDDIKATFYDYANNDGDGFNAMSDAYGYRYRDILENIDIPDIFQNFHEVSNSRYEINYIWCLWAIVHGIKRYDKFKKGD